MRRNGGGTREVFLDNNSTTAILPEVASELVALYECGPLNPSSVHGAGDRARRYLHTSREQLAALIEARPSQLVFTSGATEANHLLLENLLRGSLRGFRLITTEVEHSSILQAARELEANGHDVHVLPVDQFGRPDLDRLADLVVPDRTLASVQWANNETGVLQRIGEVAFAVKARGGLVHSDATQAVGKIPVSVGEVPVDYLSLSSHKFHGPAGAGALFVREPGSIRAPLPGGGQERGLRPGTENVPALVGMGVAAAIRKARLSESMRRVAALRDQLESELEAQGIVEAINGAGVDRLPNTSNVRFGRVDGEALVLRLDSHGIRCSQSSACTNRKPEPSYVLRAMGLSEEQAYRSVRFSLSEFTTDEEIALAVRTIGELHTALVRFHTLTA